MYVCLFSFQFNCCGARHSESGYQDWQQNVYFNCTPDNPSALRCGVPRSCCIIEPVRLAGSLGVVRLAG